MPNIKIGSILEISVEENIGGGMVDKKSFDRNYQIVGYYRGLMRNPSIYGNPKEKGICLTSANTRDGGNNCYIGFENSRGYSFLIAKRVKVIRSV